MSKYTVLLPMLATVMLAIPSIYLPLFVATGESLYLVSSILYDSVLAIPTVWIAKKMKEAEKQLATDIQKLRKRYNW